MDVPAVPLLFPGQSAPESAARRRFRALARSAPWLSTSLQFQVQVPGEYAKPEDGLEGTLTAIIRQREAIAVRSADGQLVYQQEKFTADRSRGYVAATNSSWKLPASLTSPVYTSDQLILRRPDISGFNGLLPLEHWESMLDPVELAGTEPASHDLAFDHPTYIHELAEIAHDGRPALAAVLTAGHTYQPTLASAPLVPEGARTLLVLDLATGVCLNRRVLAAPSGMPPAPELSLQVLAHNEYYIDSLFTAPAPTLTDVRAPIPWELRSERRS